MDIRALLKTTLLDFPGYVACTVFTGGCNLRCAYCHNRAFLDSPAGQTHILEDEIFSFLLRRQGLLQGVCVSGGEPTLNGDLLSFVRKIKDMGFLVKLDTNGTNPTVLKELAKAELVDYVAMDAKLPFEDYGKLFYNFKEAPHSLSLHYEEFLNQNLSEKVRESAKFLLDSGGSNAFDYEMRVTLAKGLHTIQNFERICSQVAGAKAFYLQSYQRVAGCEYQPFSVADMNHFLGIAKEYVPNAKLRGVEEVGLIM